MTADRDKRRPCYIERTNPFFQGAQRRSFCCLEVNIPKDSEFMKRVCDKALELAPRLNPGGANDSEIRDEKRLEANDYSGTIAEFACEEILVWLYGRERIIKPASAGSFNQIDIRLDNGKTIEVRSSCVRNGLDFALFAMDRKKPGQQYFDVIGPYSNAYKAGESFKDYYMRVLYACDIKDFMKLLQDERKYMTLYITGGATMEMMQDEAYYQIKHLLPEGGQVEQESDYRVIPLAKSLDAREFLHRLEQDNGMRALHPL